MHIKCGTTNIATWSCCRRLRPGRPLGHCLNQSKIPSCDTLVARCLDFIFKMYKKKDGGKKVKTKLLDGILKGPGKLVLCCLIIVREPPRGTHFPWAPTLCTDKLYKMWGGKVRELPLGETSRLLPNSTHIQILLWKLNSTYINLLRKWKLRWKIKTKHRHKQNSTYINLLRKWKLMIKTKQNTNNWTETKQKNKTKTKQN